MRLFVAVRGFLGMNRDQPPALLEPKVYGEPPNLVVDKSQCADWRKLAARNPNR